MTVLIVIGVVLVVVVVLVGEFVLAGGGGERCTGDALSGFLPCSNYPDCDCS